MKHDSDTILRQESMLRLCERCIQHGWDPEAILPFLPAVADAIFGPAPIIDSQLALDLDKALHETAAAPTPAAQAAEGAPAAAKAGTGEGPQSQPVPAARFVFNAVAKPDPVAQRTERRSPKPEAAGSTPAGVAKEVGEAAPAAVTTTPTNDGGHHVAAPGTAETAEHRIAQHTGTPASSPPLPHAGPVIEITSPQMNVLEALCQMADRGNSSPTIAQLTMRSGEPSVVYQIKGLIEAKCIKNTGQIGAPAYVILRRFDDPNVRRRPMQARYTKPAGIMTE